MVPRRHAAMIYDRPWVKGLVETTAMPQTNKFDPTKQPIGKRRCPKCGVPMLLSLIEPSELEGCDERTFECAQCAYAEAVTVKFD